MEKRLIRNKNQRNKRQRGRDGRKFSKSLLFCFLASLFLSLPLFATSIKENILSGLVDIKNTIQHSNNKPLSSFISEIDFVIEDIDIAVSYSEDNCNSEIRDITSRLGNLVSNIESKRCKKSKNKKSRCIPIATANNLVSKINNISDSLNAVSNSDEVLDICLSSNTANPNSSSSGSSANDGNGQTAPITNNDDVITSCDQSEVLHLESVLNSDKLTFSTKAVADTKLDLGGIEFYRYPLSNGDIYVAKNTSYVPVEVMVSVNDPANVSSSVPAVISLSPKSQQFGFKVCAVDNSIPWNYKYSFADKQGFSTSVYTGDGKYLLPFKAGESYIVVQGEMGTFSHFGDFLYSIDFGMPEGTEITAMRDGTVVFVKEDSNEGGPDLSFLDKANFIWILHDDNSIGRYVHLKQNGALVNVGDKVKAGDVIGLSGNTGYTSGPHLHVQVVLQKGFSGTDLIPIRFKCINGALVEGQSYTATICN